MRVETPGNLTLELIRHERFGDGRFDPCNSHRLEACLREDARLNAHASLARCDRLDHVVLSSESLACDPWSLDINRAGHHDAWRLADHASHQLASPPEVEAPPKDLVPVIGSPALAGLGVALIVPGSLLDVVA